MKKSTAVFLWFLAFVLALFIQSCATEAGQKRRAAKRVNRIIKNNPSAIKSDTEAIEAFVQLPIVSDSLSVKNDTTGLDSALTNIIAPLLDSCIIDSIKKDIIQAVNKAVKKDTIINRSWGSIEIKSGLGGLDIAINEKKDSVKVNSYVIKREVKPSKGKPPSEFERFVVALSILILLILIIIYIIKKIFS